MKESATQWSVMHAKIQMCYIITTNHVNNFHSLVMITQLQQNQQIQKLVVILLLIQTVKKIAIVRVDFFAWMINVSIGV